MPEKTEDLFEPRDQSVLEQTTKTNNKCKNILKIFRNIRKEKGKGVDSTWEEDDKKCKKKACRDSEERKEMLQKNMEDSWTELPTTLKRQKEKISQEILSEFHDSDSNDTEQGSNGTDSDGSPETKIENCDMSKPNYVTKTYLTNSNETEEIFSHNKIDLDNEVKEEFPQVKHDEVKASEIKDVTSDQKAHTDEGKGSKETIKDISKPANITSFVEKHQETLEGKTRTTETFGVTCIETKIQEDPKFKSSEKTHVRRTSLCINTFNFNETKSYENEKTKNETTILTKFISSEEVQSKRSISSNGEFIESERFNEDEIKDVSSELPNETDSNSLEQCVEITYESEIKSDKETLKSEEEKGSLPRNESENVSNTPIKNSVQTSYSEIIFSPASNTLGLFVNEEFEKNDVANESEEENERQSEDKVIYQELDFTKSTERKEESKIEADKEVKKTEENKNEVDEKKKLDGQPSEHPITGMPSRLTEEQRAKKKSAEAIAKELSSQIFSKRIPKSEGSGTLDEKKFILPKTSKDNVLNIFNRNVEVSEGTRKEEKTEPNESITHQKNQEDATIISESGKKAETKPLEEKTKEKAGENKSEISEEVVSGKDGNSLMTDWRKALSVNSKRGTSVAMDTIVEESETEACIKLTVREILKKFEGLGNKDFGEKVEMTDDERAATLKEIYQSLKCLEEKVKNLEMDRKHQQFHENTQRAIERSTEAWTGGRGPSHRVPRSLPVRNNQDHEDETAQTSVNDGKHSLLQFAIHHFRQSPEKFEMLKNSDTPISGSLKANDSKNKKNKEKGKGGKDSSEWTWKEQVDLVKFTAKPIEQSLLHLDTPELSDLAVECFVCLMRYMGDLPMPTDVSEVKCVYTILMHCHKYEQLRDEIYCHLMKQTTNNKSIQAESCQRGWRLFSIVAAYFVSSDTLKPFLFKYLETAAYDKRRAYHGTAMVCLQNLRKTFKYGGRKNVPSVEEITAISAGRNSKRQIYRLPGGTEKVVNTKSTTVVQDVIEELCVMINVTNPQEMEEFSVYCIVEGDTFTMPLAREEYILDVTTELHKNHQVFYLIFCRSVWYFPLRLDSQLYVEVVFNQIAPDYLEGLLLVMPGESLEQDVIYDISKIAALLHRAADMTHIPSMKETKFLLPKPALSVRDVKPSQWVNMVQSNWQDCENMTAIQAKAQVLDVLSKWPLFGSSFFAVKKAVEPKERTDHILALNRTGVHFIDLITHETLLHYPFSEVISTRKVKSEDGTLFLDMKCGNLMQQRITRLQTDQAHEISRLIRQYITMQQRMGLNQM